jgi:hypothetical protein
MSRLTVFSVKLRRSATGEEHVRAIFARDAATAKTSATANARAVLPLFIERRYERFDVMACDVNARDARVTPSRLLPAGIRSKPT